MLGFSIQKLLVLAAIIVAIVYFFKWVGRAQKKRDSLRKGRKNKPTMDSDSMRHQVDLEEMVQCALCGTYLAASDLQNCGKPDCPYS